MSFDTALTKSVKRTQADPMMGREGEMVENTAGGYVFEADKWERLMRFLLLGTEGGTYYIKEKQADARQCWDRTGTSKGRRPPGCPDSEGCFRGGQGPEK